MRLNKGVRVLIANNGAVKSGTTWVQQILRKLDTYDQLPERWQKRRYQNQSVDEPVLAEFLDSDDFKNGRYLTKTHYHPRYAELLDREGVIVINCARSIPDMVVSYYHHARRKQGVTQDIDAWMAENAIQVARNRIEYLRGWAHVPTLHFETIFADVEAAAVRLAGLVGSPLTEAEVRLIGRKSQKTPGDKQDGKAVRTGRPGAGREEIPAAYYAALCEMDEELLALFPERAGLTADRALDPA